jgi:formylglycine-generating enzyme required for sulfatase activity
MRRVIIVLIISLITVTFATSKEPCYEKTRSKGIALYNAGKYADAIKYFELALNTCPDTPANNDLQKRINDCNSAMKRLVDEKEAREKEARDKEARDKAARDKEAKDKEARDKEARDKEAREKTEREKKAKEQEELAKRQQQQQQQQPQSKTIEIPMVYVKGGTFTMGCTNEQGSDCSDWEKAHQVTLSSYYIGKYEVTQKEWLDVMGSWPVIAPSSTYGVGDNYPAYYVSWNDIVGSSGSTQIINGITYYSNGFIYKLNQQTGISYRLPTEAEWEFAARGGNQSRGYKYSGSNTADNVAWYYNNSDRKTHPVGTKQANELCINDMSGNVWEWCADSYGYYSSAAQSNPICPTTGSYRVYRGGSWNYYDARDARVSVRNFNYPEYRHYYIGFRLACSP